MSQNTPKTELEILKEKIMLLLDESKEVFTSDKNKKAQEEPRRHFVNDTLELAETQINKLQGAEKQIAESLEEVKRK